MSEQNGCYGTFKKPYITSGQDYFYCPNCNCNTFAYYQKSKCPVCGEIMQQIIYRISEDENGGEYTVTVKQKET